MTRFHNLFLAVRPPLAIANAIIALRRSNGLSGQWLPRERLHVSLLSLGQHSVMPLKLIDKVEALLAEQSLFSCDLRFDQLVFGRTRSLLTSSNALPDVGQLQTQLAEILTSGGVAIGRNRPRPHITLGYHQPAGRTRAVDPIGWTAREMVLIDSLYGEGKHLTMARWPLGLADSRKGAGTRSHALPKKEEQLPLFV